jgi:uncharacterized protein YqgC (DUF456 family)
MVETNLIFQLLAYVLMFVGLIGALLPLIPGAPLIWLGALLWAWADGFQHVGVPTLIALAALAALSWGADLVVTALTTRKAGAGWQTVAVAIVCGLAGAVLFGGAIPLVGPIVGTLAGASFGIVLVEYRRQRTWRGAWWVAAAYVAGYVLSGLAQIAICGTMIALFVWQAFF